jgi:hypothetical protein
MNKWQNKYIFVPNKVLISPHRMREIVQDIINIMGFNVCAT